MSGWTDAHQILRPWGIRGAQVVQLQRQLNAKLNPSPNLSDDGIFGQKTKKAVLEYQKAEWLVEDAAVGPATWNALFDAEAYQPILHKSTPFIPQPTAMTCWAASTAMLTKTSVPAVMMKTPSDIADATGAYNYSNTSDAVTESLRYAKIHNLRFVPPMSWSPQMLRSYLVGSPLMFDTLWDVEGYLTPVQGSPGQYRGSPGHMILAVGIRGSGNPDGYGTTLRIYDPWPPTKGRIYSVGYAKWVQEVPTRTYRTFHR